MILGLLSIILISCNEKNTKIKIEKVLLFGDSLMAGYGLPGEEHLSVVLEESLRSEGHNIEIINGSFSGSLSRIFLIPLGSKFPTAPDDLISQS